MQSKIEHVIRRTLGCTCKEAHKATIAIIEHIVAELKNNGDYAIQGFGKFTVHNLKLRSAINHNTGEKIKAKAEKVVRFKSSLELRKKMSTCDEIIK